MGLQGIAKVDSSYTRKVFGCELGLADLVLDDEHVVSESITSLPNIAKNEVKTGKTILKNVSAPIIQDWVSDSEDEDEIETESNQIKPSFAKTQVRIFDSGCSRHMTGNKSFLIDYQDFDRGYVAFGGSPKGDLTFWLLALDYLISEGVFDMVKQSSIDGFDEIITIVL
uniref:Zinc finger, CCHC-type n=1 Tax=Tanacetum cinerariifolium TaxID=118510 RepID=A0A6L2NNQ0_TANCI|nr:zinc finger, CCHC-type [Tanacetum cinerariifolium]